MFNRTIANISDQFRLVPDRIVDFDRLRECYQGEIAFVNT